MRRFKIPVGVIVCLALWTLSLCVPTVRELPGSFVLYDLRGITSPDDFEEKLDLPNAPEDAVGAAWRAEVEFRRGDKGAIEAVAKRYPADVRIKALQLFLAAKEWKGLKKMRQQKDAMQVEQWMKSAQIAREAASIEPENAFWPWMEAAFEFAAHRDDAALLAFERAAKCARYQDYSLLINQERVQWLQRHRALAWEQKLMIFSSANFSQLGPLRQSSFLASQSAGALRQNGQIRRALSVEVGVLNANRLARRDSKFSTTATTAEFAAFHSLEEFLGVTRLSGSQQAMPVALAARSQDLVRAWDKFTRRNGRPELASAASFVGAPPIDSIFRQEDDVTLEIYGLQSWQGNLAVIAPYILSVLAITIALGAVFWLIGWPFHFESEKPTRGQVAFCANFSFWLFAASATGYYAFYGYYLNPLISEFWSVSKVAPLIVALAIFCWLLPAWFVSWRHGRARVSTEQGGSGRSGVQIWLPRILWVAAIALFILGIYTVQWSGASSDVAVFGVAAATIALGALKLGWRVAQPDYKFGWQLTRRSAGVLVMMWSVAFLLMAIGAWPLRAQLNRSLNRELQIGEVAWMREQVAKVKQP